MKYILFIAFFATLALTSAFPSDDVETSKVEPEVKAETADNIAEKTAEETAKADATITEAKETVEKMEVPMSDSAAEDKCEPGSTFQNDCNTCTCPPSGLRSAAGCTLKLCLDAKPTE